MKLISLVFFWLFALNGFLSADNNNLILGAPKVGTSQSGQVGGAVVADTVKGPPKKESVNSVDEQEQLLRNILSSELKQLGLIYPQLRVSQNEELLSTLKEVLFENREEIAEWVAGNKESSKFKSNFSEVIQKYVWIAKDRYFENQKKMKEAEAREAENAKKRALEKVEEQRQLEIQNNFGFREIKPGRTLDEIEKIANCRLKDDFYMARFESRKCYGIQDYVFWATVDNLDVITMVALDLGQVNSMTWYDFVINNADPEDGNIYGSMRITLDAKYKLDYEFSDRDLQRFNNGEKNALMVVYEKGKVVLRVERILVSDYVKEVKLRLYYFNEKIGESFYKKFRPVKASKDDF